VFVELHLIQSFGPHCLNRDDTNQPKDCTFGGFRRARISSQCIKRSIRWHEAFRDATAPHAALRTRWIHAKLADLLRQRGRDATVDSPVIKAYVAALGLKFDKNDRTQYGLYVGLDEVDRMAADLDAKWDTLAGASDAQMKKEVEPIAKALKLRTQAADIALFGRMIADRPGDNVDAACQVAHAISTHKVDMEMDFFTAVDDLKQADDEPGAGMMGTVDFNSSCFYRYALLDFSKLVANLGGDVALARASAEGFLRAAVAAIPTGKQSSFAAHNPPEFILAVVREKGAWSLANAFEKPVRATAETGLTEASVEALDGYFSRLASLYGTDGIVTRPACWLSDAKAEHAPDPKVGSLEELIGTVMDALPKAEEG